MSQIFDITLGRWRPLTTADLATGGGGGGGGGTVGGALETTQVSVQTAVQNVDVNIGAKADAAASSDAGTFSLIALLKRGLANWTTLLARIPALAGGRVPVDISGAIQLGAGTMSATTQRVTLASDGPEVTNSTATVTKLTSIDGKVPATLGRKTAATSLAVALPTDVPTDLVADSAGMLFSPGSEAMSYNYDNGTGLLSNAVVTVGGVTRMKTYTWTSGNLTNESKWVVQ